MAMKSKPAAPDMSRVIPLPLWLPRDEELRHWHERIKQTEAMFAKKDPRSVAAVAAIEKEMDRREMEYTPCTWIRSDAKLPGPARVP